MLPEALHQKAMSLCHDSPTAGHQGTLKTWETIRQEAYWVNMAQDVDRHYRECVTCQKAKLPMPVRSTLTNIPIGRSWQMIAIDILEVPVSTTNNRYLLVIQDYFTKWADAGPPVCLWYETFWLLTVAVTSADALHIGLTINNSLC